MSSGLSFSSSSMLKNMKRTKSDCPQSSASDNDECELGSKINDTPDTEARETSIDKQAKLDRTCEDANGEEKPSKSELDPTPDNKLKEMQEEIKTTQPQNGYKLNDFDVERTLGTGSYGRVLLVKHKQSGLFYAVKRLKKADVVRLKQVEHTNNEERLLRVASACPFTVTLISSFQDAKSLYLLMEYVEGGELFSLLRRVRTLPVFMAQFYAAQVILAIEHLHSHGIVYRDLKPENVLIASDGNLKLTDFGFAKKLNNNSDSTYTFCGTPEYLAPEIIGAIGSGYTRAVDWWAVGVLIYEMVFGRPPFYHDNHLKLYDMIVKEAVVYPKDANPVLVDLLEQLLEKNPTKRLGALKDGPRAIKEHPWFRDQIKWEHIAQRTVRPPYRPRVSGPGDASNFDKYPEDPDQVRSEDVGEDPFGHLFPNFVQVQ